MNAMICNTATERYDLYSWLLLILLILLLTSRLKSRLVQKLQGHVIHKKKRLVRYREREAVVEQRSEPSVYDTANRYVFKCRLKVDSDDADVTKRRGLFQARTATTEKARSPIVLRLVTGTSTAVNELECKRRLRLVSTTSVRFMLSARYTGAVPLRHRRTRDANLKVIRSGTRSQWSSQSSGVTWSNFRALKIIRAAAWRTDCSR